MSDRILEMFNDMNDSLMLKECARVNTEECEFFSYGNKPKEKTTSSQDSPPDESFHFKRYSKNRIHKYTEEEMNSIRNGCLNTIVNDYSMTDVYHMSDEERSKNDKLAEIAMKLATVKSVYRRLDQYIEAMRVVFKAWEILSENNYVHSKKEFFRMVAEGKIISGRIIIPQLKNFKKYDIDIIIKYISNPNLDASIFAPKEKSYNDYFEEINEDEIDRLFSENELKEIEESLDNKIKVDVLDPSYIKHYVNHNKNKKHKYSQEVFNKIVDSHNGYKMFLIDSNARKNPYDSIRIKGSWRKKHNLEQLLWQLDDAHMDDYIIKYGEKINNKDKYLKDFYQEMSKYGIDSVELRKNIMLNETKKESISDKENKKKEKEILQRIIKMNNDKGFIEQIKKAEEEINKYVNKEDNENE